MVGVSVNIIKEEPTVVIVVEVRFVNIIDEEVFVKTVVEVVSVNTIE